MKSFSLFLEDAKPVTKSDLNALEGVLDKLFEKLGIDIEFTKHFLDRVNDKRNKKQITIGELKKVFTQTYFRYKDALVKFKDKFQAVLVDLQTDINIPFVLNWDRKAGEMDLVSKTVMRKKGFKTSNRKLKV